MTDSNAVAEAAQHKATVIVVNGEPKTVDTRDVSYELVVQLD